MTAFLPSWGSPGRSAGPGVLGSHGDRKWATGLGHHAGDGATIAFPDDRLAVYVRITGRDIGAERMTEMRDQLVLLTRDTARPAATEH